LETNFALDSNEMAQIQSPLFSKQDQYFCFEFWYFMFGNQIHQLNIYVKYKNNQTESLFWRLNGEQGYEWKRATLPLNIDEEFYLIIEGFAGDGING
jgi:hypothetical protein